MIDQAIRLLTLHIIWKARLLTAVVDPLPEAASFSETLREQRESLLEKLVEYAVGTQSNTADGVKRAVNTFLVILSNAFPHSMSKGLPQLDDSAHSILQYTSSRC
jgi:cohesin complex subunit SA-1/2